MKKNLMVLSGVVLGFAPVVAFAQTAAFCSTSGATSGTLQNILCKVGAFLNAAIPIIIVLAVLYFIWGVISYVIAGDEEKKSSARSVMVYGIIGLAVIVGIWGLVNILLNSFGVNKDASGPLPTVTY
jgi:uncharacterized membrane protein HdeD (DUF308 family)